MGSEKKIRRIFVSDIHMGDERSTVPGGNFHPYCWFCDDRPDMLAGFLKQHCIDDEDVTEVVIVGDLFDEWVCPTQFDPTDHSPRGQQFENVADAPQNQAVMARLRELASSQRLTFLRGNHDILANKPVMQRILPGIRHPGRDDGLDEGSHDVYRTDDGIWAEHGHWYGLFNAPFHPGGGAGGFAGSVFPLGFFVSRITAQKVLRTGGSIDGLGVFLNWIGHIHRTVAGSTNPARAMGGETHDLVDGALMGLFDTLVKENAPDQPGALLNGLDNIPGLVSWQEVKNRYGRIFSRWSADHKENVNPYDAIWTDAGSLDRAVSSVFFRNDEVKIVICGHTHRYDFSSTLGPFQPDALIPTGTERIYANSGAWANSKPRCTFVETEFDPETGNHSVRLREWFRQASDGQCAARDVRPEETIRGDVWVRPATQ